MNILAVTCMRNEGPYCLEWIAHHRAAGVTDFLIFTHDCDDGTDRILDLLPDVTHVPFDPIEGKSVQWRAMQLADRHPRMQTADWVLFFDCDEFLCLQAPLATIPELIRAQPEGTDAIALPWRLFGSSHHRAWATGLTLERFDKAAPEPFSLPAGHFFKALYKNGKFQKLGVHRPKNKGGGGQNWMLGGTQTAPAGFEEDDKRINLFGLMSKPAKARLNHYSTRSVTEFIVKRARGLPNRRSKHIDLSYWAERNFNTAKNTEIAHMLPATKSALDRLTEIDGVSELFDQSIQAHRAKFQTLMQDRKTVMLFLHLSLLDGSHAPTSEQISTHLSFLTNADKSAST